jgi:hypothetical protein
VDITQRFSKRTISSPQLLDGFWLNKAFGRLGSTLEVTPTYPVPYSAYSQWRTEKGFWGSNSRPLPPEIPKFWQSWAEFPVPWKVYSYYPIRIRVSLICKLSGTNDYRATSPRSPFSLWPQLNLLNPHPDKNYWPNPPKKFLGTPLPTASIKGWDFDSKKLFIAMTTQLKIKCKITSDMISATTINLNTEQININAKYVYRVRVPVRKYVYIS